MRCSHFNFDFCIIHLLLSTSTTTGSTELSDQKGAALKAHKSGTSAKFACVQSPTRCPAQATNLQKFHKSFYMRDALPYHTSASPPIACFLQWHMISEWAGNGIDRVHFRRFNGTYNCSLIHFNDNKVTTGLNCPPRKQLPTFKIRLKALHHSHLIWNRWL